MDAQRKQELIDDYEEQLYDMGMSDTYTALDMVETREDEVVAALAAGQKWVCLKVPSHFETEMLDELARELLDDLKARRARRGW